MSELFAGTWTSRCMHAERNNLDIVWKETKSFSCIFMLGRMMVLKFWMSTADFEWWIWHGCVSMECHGSGGTCGWYRSLEMLLRSGWGWAGLMVVRGYSVYWACTLLKVIRFLRVGMSEAIKSWSMSFCSEKKVLNFFVCTHVITSGAWSLHEYWSLCEKTHPIGSVDGPSIRLGNIKKDSGCADNAGPVTCICHDESLWFILSHLSASQNRW